MLLVCVFAVAGLTEFLGTIPATKTSLTPIRAFGQEMPEGRLMRFPDIGKDQIVFSYAGDLWLVPRTGGTARRITSDPGLELFPKFSPDGT